MARNWWGLLRARRPSKVDPEEELQTLIENGRNLLPRLNQLLVESRMHVLRVEDHAREVYSTNEARGKLQEPQFQERFRTLIENWRTIELVFLTCALRVTHTKDTLMSAIELKREALTAIRLGIKPPQLSEEQEALLRMEVEHEIFTQDIMNSIQKAVDSRHLYDYFKSLGHKEMPAEITSTINRTYSDYIDLIVESLAKDQMKVTQLETQKPQTEQATATTPTKLPFIAAQRETTKDKNMVNTEPRVFLIHGHDQLALRSAESLLHRIGCQPVIFSRIPDKATRTNIEILEKHLPSCDAVVVLLTPDDEGRKKGTDTLEPRARQNVLVEAGFAIISRRATSLIVALGDVSIPSDFDGINRIQTSTWNTSTDIDLARELSNMLGLSLDIRRI